LFLAILLYPWIFFVSSVISALLCFVGWYIYKNNDDHWISKVKRAATLDRDALKQTVKHFSRWVSKNYYVDLFSWSHVQDDRYMIHSDGTVSVALSWDGIDCTFASDEDIEKRWDRFYLFLNNLLPKTCVEFHLFREQGSEVIDTFMAKPIKQRNEFAEQLRSEQAEHLRQFAMTNKAYVIISVPADVKPHWFLRHLKLLFGNPFSKRSLSRSIILIDHMIKMTLSKLPGARLCDAKRYLSLIQQSSHRRSFVAGYPIADQPSMLINEMMASTKPMLLENDMLYSNGMYTKMLYMIGYPEHHPDWFGCLSACNTAFHVSHIVKAPNTVYLMEETQKEIDGKQGNKPSNGSEYSDSEIGAAMAFKKTVASNRLGIFDNCYVIALHHHDPSVLDTQMKFFIDRVESFGGTFLCDSDVQYPFFRYVQPGMGYKSIFRPDHTWTVGQLLPVQVYREGDKNPDLIRLATTGNIFGVNYSDSKLLGTATIAKTGSGKGMLTQELILSLYLANISTLIAELSPTQQWLVEAFKGSYTTIDPDNTFVNPLPPYSMASSTKQPLSSFITNTTLSGLAYILTGFKCKELNVHEQAAAALALNVLYAVKPDDRESPTLPEFLSFLQEYDYYDGNRPQIEAAKTMSENLASILDSPEGRQFSGRDNLILTPHITGVDFQNLEDASNPKTLHFWFILVSLKFKLMALRNSQHKQRTQILFDEMHFFADTDPELFGHVCSMASRTGRKRGGGLNLTTQSRVEIDAVNLELLNSMRYMNILYHEDGHDELAKRIRMPDPVLQVWRRYDDPIDFDYRPGITKVGSTNYYDTYFTYCDRYLALGNTDEEALRAKLEITKKTNDIKTRLEAFQAWMQDHKARAARDAELSAA